MLLDVLLLEFEIKIPSLQKSLEVDLHRCCMTFFEKVEQLHIPNGTGTRDNLISLRHLGPECKCTRINRPEIRVDSVVVVDGLLFFAQFAQLMDLKWFVII